MDKIKTEKRFEKYLHFSHSKGKLKVFPFEKEWLQKISNIFIISY